MAILAFLQTRKAPVTVAEVFAALSLQGCDIVTVYRTMDTFEEMGLVKRYYRKNGAVAFLLIRHANQLFVESERGVEPVRVGAELLARFSRATAALEKQLRSLGNQDVEAVIEFFGRRLLTKRPRERTQQRARIAVLDQ